MDHILFLEGRRDTIFFNFGEHEKLLVGLLFLGFGHKKITYSNFASPSLIDYTYSNLESKAIVVFTLNTRDIESTHKNILHKNILRQWFQNLI